MKRTDPVGQRHLFRQLQWSEIDPAFIRRLINLAREEDLAGGGLVAVPPESQQLDATTSATGAEATASAQIIAREPLRICGLVLIPLLLEAYGTDGTVELHRKDEEEAAAGDLLATLQGPGSLLLQVERVMLNFLQHLSGISSETARYVSALDGSTSRLLDTRKTTPGWRVLEKYAVACGGGWTHRIGLFDRIMLKDNHLAASGSTAGDRLSEAVTRAQQSRPDLLVEVEVDHLNQIPPVLEAGADIILLDNFPLEQLNQAIKLIGDQAYTEASGGVTLKTLPALGQVGLDFISCGAITHQSRWKDIALDWVE